MSKNIFIQAHPVVAALMASVIMVAVSMLSFMVFEPAVSFAITDTFTVEQEITSEIAFQTVATDVIMSPDLAGITGGISSGTTTVAVTTNDVDGYTLAIRFADTVAMQYESGSDSIPNFVDGGNNAYNFSVSTGVAAFALSASSTNVVSAFRNDGAACNAGTNRSAAKCWTMEAVASSSLTLVDRSSSTPAEGEETIIGFRVGVNDPTPALPAGFYNATATLTALVK